MTKRIIDYRVINLGAGHECESWVTVYADGRLIEHVENDAHRFLRRGAEAVEQPITITEAAQLGILAQVWAAMCDMHRLF